MDKLIKYVCDELDKIEQMAASGKLSFSDIEYADKLAHLKKNLLKADELMEGYSGENRGMDSFRGGMYSRRGNSYDERGSYEGRGGRGSSFDNRGRGSNAQRDSRGRYSSADNYSRYLRDDYSMDAGEIVEDLRELMNQAPDDRMRQEIKKIMNKAEEMAL